MTYCGANTSDYDFGPVMALSVAAPATLSVPNTPTCQYPDGFIVQAFATNTSNLFASGGIPLNAVSFNLTLPQGLTLNPPDYIQKANPGLAADTASKLVTAINPGQEKAATWKVYVDTSTGNQRSGPLTFLVTASADGQNGKSVQRSIEVPAQPVLRLADNARGQGQWQFVSFPLQFNGAKPTDVLFPGQPADQFRPDLARWDPSLNAYRSVSTFNLGEGYWIRNRVTNPQHADTVIPLNCTTYQPLPVNTEALPFRITYQKFWNQIGNPYVYGIRFSEIQVFDPATLQLYTMDQAVDPSARLVLPAIYTYDTSDPDPANWHRVLEDNLGFTMQPLVGYWVYLYKPGLQFIYPINNTPQTDITASKAAIVGSGLGSKLGRNVPDNWRLRLTAKSATGLDIYTYLGVAPKAVDGMDGYKYLKPPDMNSRLSLNIVHDDWKEATRFAQDLRSPARTAKTWNLEVTSGKPNEDVTIAWPDLTKSVPRSYKLQLIDTATNAKLNLRNRSSLVVNTGATSNKRFQIVAEPASRSAHVQILSFNVAPSHRAAGQGVSMVAFDYSLSDTAEAHFIIRDSRGRNVRQVEPSTRAAGSPNSGTAVWDMHNQRGIVMPSGTYQVELAVTTPDGSRARQIRPFTVIR